MPPFLWRPFAASLDRYQLVRFGFFGNFPDYESASKESHHHYGAEQNTFIKSRIEQSLKALKDEPHLETIIDQRTLRLFAAIQMAAGTKKKLRIVDFGGQVGSHWMALRRFFVDYEIEWQVIETATMVDAGNRIKYITDHSQYKMEVSFFEDLSLIQTSPDIVLASGSIQYMPQPEKTLADLKTTRAPWIIIDRCPIFDSDQNRLTIQKVNAEQSYPAWFFSERRWKELIEKIGLHPKLLWKVPEDTIFLDGKWIVYSGGLYSNHRSL
jgi:putative methyltransferase (TIGR04325 family)